MRSPTTVLQLHSPVLYHIASLLDDAKDLMSLCSSSCSFAHVCRQVFEARFLPGGPLYTLSRRLAGNIEHYFCLEIQDARDLYSRLSVVIEDGMITVRIVYHIFGTTAGGALFHKSLHVGDTTPSDFDVVDDYFRNHYAGNDTIAIVIHGNDRFDVSHKHLAAYIRNLIPYHQANPCMQ